MMRRVFIDEAPLPTGRYIADVVYSGFLDNPGRRVLSYFVDPAYVSAIAGGSLALVQSNGAFGVVADGLPTAGTVVLLQERNKVLVEVGRLNTGDGTWAFEVPQGAPTHAVAFSDGYNAGVAAFIDMAD